MAGEAEGSAFGQAGKAEPLAGLQALNPWARIGGHAAPPVRSPEAR